MSKDKNIVIKSAESIERALKGLRPDIGWQEILDFGKKLAKIMVGATSSLVATRKIGEQYREQMRAMFSESFILELAGLAQEKRKAILNTPAGIPFRLINEQYRNATRDAAAKANKELAVDNFNSNLSIWVGYMAKEIEVDKAEKARLLKVTNGMEKVESAIVRETNKDKKAKLRNDHAKLSASLVDKKEIITKIVKPVSDADKRGYIKDSIVKTAKFLGSLNALTSKDKDCIRATRALGIAYGVVWDNVD